MAKGKGTSSNDTIGHLPPLPKPHKHKGLGRIAVISIPRGNHRDPIRR